MRAPTNSTRKNKPTKATCFEDEPGTASGSRHFVGGCLLGAQVKNWLLLLVWLILLLIPGCRQTAGLHLDSPGQEPKRIELGKDRTFSLRYIHSVEKTPVIEYFRVQDDGRMILTATAYQSYGVGLPSLPEEGHLKVADGWLFLEGLHRVYHDIRIRVGPEARISLEVEGKTYPIHEWYPPGLLVVIRQDFNK